MQRVPHTCPISAHHEWNFDELLDMAWVYLDLVRMYVACITAPCRPQQARLGLNPGAFSLSLERSYTKPRGQLPDYEAPVVLKRGKNTVEDFCNSIHKSLKDQFK